MPICLINKKNHLKNEMVPIPHHPGLYDIYMIAQSKKDYDLDQVSGNIYIAM